MVAKRAGLECTIGALEIDLFGMMGVGGLKDVARERAEKLLPGARSLVVVAVEVYPEVLDHAARDRKINDTSMKSLVEGHFDFLNDRLNDAVYAIAQASRKAGFRALPLPARGLPFDRRVLSAVFSYKHAAEAVGLGIIGRSSLLITPEFGPRVRFACCLTEAELKPTKGKTARECRSCRVCIDKCPSGALAPAKKGEPYSINKFACNTYRSNSFCVDCLRVCPAGK